MAAGDEAIKGLKKLLGLNKPKNNTADEGAFETDEVADVTSENGQFEQLEAEAEQKQKIYDAGIEKYTKFCTNILSKGIIKVPIELNEGDENDYYVFTSDIENPFTYSENNLEIQIKTLVIPKDEVEEKFIEITLKISDTTKGLEYLFSCAAFGQRIVLNSEYPVCKKTFKVGDVTGMEGYLMSVETYTASQTLTSSFLPPDSGQNADEKMLYANADPKLKDLCDVYLGYIPGEFENQFALKAAEYIQSETTIFYLEKLKLNVPTDGDRYLSITGQQVKFTPEANVLTSKFGGALLGLRVIKPGDE